MEAVYRELLKQYRAENIGIYGCSAGGMLTAQAKGGSPRSGSLPRPGRDRQLLRHRPAVRRGVRSYFGYELADWRAAAAIGRRREPAYLRTAQADDPIAYPGQSPELLAKFPPTLFLAGGRDFAVSAVSTMQRRLLGAGVDAELVLFDGLWHAFFVYPDLPESQEAYGLIARFFDRHLGRQPR